MNRSRLRIILPVVTLSLALLASAPSIAQTLDFDALPTEPGPASGSYLVDANAGSRNVSGVTFNAADNSDWEIYGNAFVADPAYSSDPFLQVHSGSYALAGNAFVGTDFFGNSYTGLTISTSKLLSSLYVAFDDDGGGSNDADALTIVAFGASGDLASVSTALTSASPSLLDTMSSFGGLSGVTGYRFETESADALNAAYGRAYVIIDDMSFGGSIPAVPEPATCVSLGLGLALLAAWKRPKKSGGRADSRR